MKNKFVVIAFLILSLMLTGCNTSDDKEKDNIGGLYRMPITTAQQSKVRWKLSLTKQKITSETEIRFKVWQRFIFLKKTVYQN